MNKRHALITATVFATAFAAAVPAVAQTAEETTQTTTTTTTVEKGPHKYIYYGDHDIYFAPTTKTYYWQENNEWRSGTELPPQSRTYVTSGGVTIELDTEKPYERNEWVVEHYKHKH
jgi:hypothetical protein